MHMPVDVIRNLPYRTPGEDCHRLDLYLPQAGAPCPVLVYFHGGGLESGGKNGDEANALLRLAEQGIAVASADYRLYPNAQWPQFIEDAAAAVAFVRQYGQGLGLFHSLCIGGSSAGAYLAMMLFADHSYLENAGVPPQAAKAYVFDAGQPTTHFRVLQAQGLDPRLVRIDRAAPLYHINRPYTPQSHTPPLLAITASNDLPGRLEQNRLWLKTLENLGYPSGQLHFRLIDGYEHCGYTTAKDRTGRLLYTDMLFEFLTQAVGIAPAATAL